MKIHGVKREWSRPFWVRFKKHHCPACNALLTTIKVSKVVNSKSEEAKNFDFSSGDTYMVGNIKFIWTEFQCNVCNKYPPVKPGVFHMRAKPSIPRRTR